MGEWEGLSIPGKPDELYHVVGWVGVGEGRLSNEHKGTKRGGREESTLLSQKVCSTERLIRDVDMVKKGED